MRILYIILLVLGFTGHYTLILNVSTMCVSPHLFYTPIALFFACIAVFCALIYRRPDMSVGLEGCWDDEVESAAAVRVSESFHCKRCAQSVLEFDHHCDVLDICIGKGNINRFRFFLCFHAFVCVYALHVHRILMIDCFHKQWVPEKLLVVPVFEFAIGFVVACFALFHVLLCTCRMRTYDLVKWWRRLSVRQMRGKVAPMRKGDRIHTD